MNQKICASLCVMAMMAYGAGGSYVANDTRTNNYGGLTTQGAVGGTGTAWDIANGGTSERLEGVSGGLLDYDAANLAQLRSINLKIAGNTVVGQDYTDKPQEHFSMSISRADVLLHNQTLSVKSGNQALLTTEAKDTTITLKPIVGIVEVDPNTLRATATKEGLLTADNVVRTLPQTGFKTTAMADGGILDGTPRVANTLHGQSLGLVAGQNLVLQQIKQGEGPMQYSVTTKQQLDGLESVTFGTATEGMIVDTNGIQIHGNGHTVSLSSRGLQNGEQVLSHVGDAVEDTDAINLKQLGHAVEVRGSGVVNVTSHRTDQGTEFTVDVDQDKIVNSVKESLATTEVRLQRVRTGLDSVVAEADSLSKRSRQVGAQGAALSALKPIGYDPMKPWQAMAGYGYYDGQQAGAMGIAYYPTEHSLVHGGVAIGGRSKEVMANAGMTVTLGTVPATAVGEMMKSGPMHAIYAMAEGIAAHQTQQREIEIMQEKQRESLAVLRRTMTGMEEVK